MEGINSVRIGAILALLFGSLYVLMPTAVQSDLDTRLAQTTADVAVPASAKKSARMSVEFTTDGDMDAVARAFEDRLEAAGVPIKRVEAEERIEVVVQVGANPDDVRRLAGASGEVTVHPASALADKPEETPEITAELLGVLAATEIDPEAWASRLAAQGSLAMQGPTLDVGLTDLEASGENVYTSAATVDLGDEPFAVVSVDGATTGLLTPADAGVSVHLLPTASSDASALLVTGGLGGTLTEFVEEVVEEDTVTEQKVADAETTLPAWLLDLLPNTQINLGLDLQGGVDLTLQVGLDEAVLSNVARDATRLKSKAKELGHDIQSIRPDRAIPMIWIESKMSNADLREFVRDVVSIEYAYSTSETATRHGFEMTDTRQEQVKEQAVEQVLETLRKRVDATGVKEPTIVRKGGGRINVQLPGEVDLQAAVDAIGTTAVLEFRMVNHDFDDAVLAQIISAAEKALPEEQFNDDQLLNEWLWNTKRLPESDIVLYEYEEYDGVLERTAPLVLYNEVILTGNDVNGAGVGFDQNQQPSVTLDFKPRGGQIFCEVTGKAVGKRFGIILDGQLQSAPSIREQICGGSASIDMGGSIDPLKDAQTLALVLRTGSLDAPVDLGGVTTVGASLGQDSINQGATAAILGGLVVLVFMAMWYSRSGLLANLALGLNILLVMAALATFGATLTLPGIAGIALTVGMAVDANIIIFERIREELKLGVHPRKAVDVGFDKGLVAVLDANVTTLIAGVVLYSFGTGPIKGFAVTLMVGIITTLVTALFVTRTLMDLATRNSNARLRI